MKKTDSNKLIISKKHLLPDLQGEWLKDPELLEDEEKYSHKPSEVYASFSRKISSLPRLSEEEEKALGYRAIKEQDIEAQKKLVLYNMRLALKMAHQYKRVWTNIMDLVQEASAGLAIAAQKWDPDMGTRFGTYAAYWIRAQLTKFLMTNGRLIHTANTRAGRKVYYKLPEIRRRLLLSGQTPSAELIAKEIGEDPKEVAMIMTRLEKREASLSAPIDGDGIATLQDSIADQEANPEKIYEQNEAQKLLTDVINGFKKTITEERDMAIWEKHLISSNPISLVDLGKQYGVSKQRIGQLTVRLKRAFRRYLIEQLGQDTQLSWLFNQD